jgi:hypothetical protein
MTYDAYYIPNGPKNLATTFPGIDFTQVEKYYIEVLDDSDTVLATTTINEMDGGCCDGKIRVHFLNFLGAVDAINFKQENDEFEAKSDNWQKPLASPLVKSVHGNNRFNVKANNTDKISVCDYPEEDMPWINELVASPLAWKEWAGTQGQDDDYIPVKVVDTKVFDVKEDDRFNNTVEMQIQNSHEKIIIRN